MNIKKQLLISLAVSLVSVLLIVLLWNYPLGISVVFILLGAAVFPIVLLSAFFAIWLPRFFRYLKIRIKGR